MLKINNATAIELYEALKWAWPYVANLENKTDKSNQIDELCQKVLAKVANEIYTDNNQ